MTSGFDALPAPGHSQLQLRFAPAQDGRTRIVRRRVRYPYVVLKPFWFGDRPTGIASVILQSGSGGLYGGEALGQQVVVEKDGAAHLTSQAATVVNPSRDGRATVQQVRLTAEAGAFLEYISDPLILFPRAKLQQVIEVCVEPDSVLIHADGILRHDPGELGQPFADYQHRLTVRDERGNLLARDATSIDGQGFDQVLTVQDATWKATGAVLAVAPGKVELHQEWCTAVNARLDAVMAESDRSVYASCGLLPNGAGLSSRIVAKDGQALRMGLEAIWRELRLAITGSPAPRSRK